MSSYVVNTETIDRILNHLNRDAHKLLGHQLRRLTDSEGQKYQFDDTESLTRLGNTLLTMNELATATRYHEIPDIRTDYKFKLRFAGHNHAEVYKALECFLYQCAEGNVTESILFKAVESLKADLAHEIISAMPEYQEATRG